MDGLDIFVSGTPNVGDRFLLKPFSTSASNIDNVFSTPRNLAVASPIAGSMGKTNQGSLKQVSISARTLPMSVTTPVVFTFTGTSTYTRSDETPVANTTVFTPGRHRARPLRRSFPTTTPRCRPPTTTR